jgi:hypothetical protein
MKRICLRIAAAVFFLTGIQALRSQPTASPPGPTEGFVAVCTDRTGAISEVLGFRFSFRYPAESPGWVGRGSHKEDNPCLFLPFEYKDAVVGIPLADIREIQFTDEVPPQKTGWNPALCLTLLDGSTVTGKLGMWGVPPRRFNGQTAAGPFSLPARNTRRVVFDHKRDTSAPRIVPGKQDIGCDLNSPYTISLKTWQGDQLTLQNGCFFGLEYGYRWADPTNELEALVDYSKRTFGLDELGTIRFREKGRRAAQITTAAGKTLDAFLIHTPKDPAEPIPHLGGNLERFGPARIALANVASFEIRRTAGK